jgi:hypothetical protein
MSITAGTTGSLENLWLILAVSGISHMLHLALFINRSIPPVTLSMGPPRRLRSDYVLSYSSFPPVADKRVFKFPFHRMVFVFLHAEPEESMLHISPHHLLILNFFSLPIIRLPPFDCSNLPDLLAPCL